MPRGPRAWAMHLWGNRSFLAVTVVFFLVLPTLYIPVVNHVVFMHTGITWEWAVILAAVAVFMLGAEAWKWAKRVYVKRHAPPPGVEWAAV